MRGVLEAKRRRAAAAIAAGVLALALASTLAARSASACTCGTRAAFLFWPPPDHPHPASLPLLIRAPSQSDIRIEDAAGRPIPLRPLVELPVLGLCGMPEFVIALDEEPVVPGSYRLVRGPDSADAIELTGQALRPVAAELSVTLSIERHDPITPVDSLCADRRIDGRPFSRTAHLTFDFSAPANAAALFAAAVVTDPQTPGGLGNWMLLRPTDPTLGGWQINLPLEDGADDCATATVWDASGAVVLAERLCAAQGPETRTVGVQAIVPAEAPLRARSFGCSVAAGRPDPRASPSAALLSVALAFLRIRRRPRSSGRMLRGWLRRPPITNTRIG